MTRRTYCVTGVHRSGTSVVARVLNLLGADIGPEGDMLPPAADNPRGFWENSSIKELDDRILRMMGGTWRDPPVLEPGWETDARLAPMRVAASKLVDELFGDSEIVVWKDPRTSLLLPFWQSVMPIAGTILVTRRPAEVATSLAFRNDLGPETSSMLWLRYVIAARLADVPILVVDYDEFFDDLEGVVGRVAAFIGVAAPDGEQLAAIGEFFDPEIRNYRMRPTSGGPNLALADAVYELFRREDDRTLLPVLESLDAGWVDKRRLHVELERLTADADRLREQAAASRRMLADVTRRYDLMRRSRAVRLALEVSRRMPTPVRRGVKVGIRAVRDRRAGGRGLGGTTGGAPSQTPGLPPPAPIDPAAAARHLLALEARPPVTVVIPVFNAFDDLERCLESVRRNTTARECTVLVVDDASTDPRMPGLLDRTERLDGVSVLRNAENLGYTRTVNRGIAAATGDVVLLNSDCEVTPRWLQHLIEAASDDPKIATVTALSDNAGAFSVPRVGEANPRPPHLSGDEVARLVTRTSARLRPSTPTGNGFCMYVKRAALDEIGLFDADRFPRGYGEENDFCMRAAEAGWSHVIDDATIVFHRRSASFGEEKEALIRAGHEAVDERHPTYTSRVQELVSSPVLASVQQNVADAYALADSLQERPRPRVLYVLGRVTGGTLNTNLDLMTALLDGYEPFLLTSDQQTLELARVSDVGLEVIERWSLPERLRPDAFTDESYRAIVAALLVRYAIDLVHVRLLIAHTFDVPAVARALDIPVVMSFHDFLLVCPTVHLLDERNRYCGGTCTPGEGPCRIPSTFLQGLPPLKHAFVNTWQVHVSDMLDCVDAFVTTSPTARDVFVRAYPKLEGAPFHIIEHGRDLPRSDRSPRRVGKRVRIAVPGTLDIHKGSGFIERLVELDRQQRLEFHFLGKVPSRYEHLGVMHGPYDRDDFEAILREIDPSFVGIFSIWPETYSHTLTEAWAAGVPVLVTDLGAPFERVTRQGGGWVLPHDSPEQAYEEILRICDDEAEYRRGVADLASVEIRTRAEMADDYDRLYRTTLLARRSVQEAEAKESTLPRLAVVVPDGAAGPHRGSTHVRVLRPLRHPIVAAELEPSLVDADRFVDERHAVSADAVLVQRTAVQPHLVASFLEVVASRDLPLIVDLDDDLFSIEPGDPRYDEYGADAKALRTLLGAADLVTVSTEPLRASLGLSGVEAVVVPNALDELLWFGDSAAAGTPTRDRSDRCELVYIGTATHGRDIEVLRAVLDRLRTHHGVAARLSVIGAEPDGPGQDWYDRIAIPSGASSYDRFVAWLRSQAGRWDVALAPLEDSALNRAKSDLKFLEYSALGLPGVYQALPPYEAAVDHGENGLLAGKGIEEWAAAIAQLAGDAELRQRIAATARRDVLQGRCVAMIAPAHVRALTDAISGGRS